MIPPLPGGSPAGSWPGLDNYCLGNYSLGNGNGNGGSMTIYDPANYDLRNAVGPLIGRTRAAFMAALDERLAAPDLKAAAYIVLVPLANHNQPPPPPFLPISHPPPPPTPHHHPPP